MITILETSQVIIVKASLCACIPAQGLTSGSSGCGAQNGNCRHPAMDLLGDERLEDRAGVGVDAGRQVLRSRLGTLKCLHARASCGGGEHVEGHLSYLLMRH